MPQYAPRRFSIAGGLLLSVLMAAALAHAEGSTSMSTAGHGWLENGAKMAQEGRYHSVLSVTRRRGHVYGTDELVAGLLQAAEAVHAVHGGARLTLGNLSRRTGGDISSSVSHNSGRDADIAFFTTTKSGRSIRPARLYRYDAKGRSGSLRFDVIRNWELVKHLLQSPLIQVQHIYVYEPLKQRLLERARTLREPRALIMRADRVLSQPVTSLPHDDHFHIRIYCSEDDRLAGCLNTGPVHEWVDDFSDSVGAVVEALIPRIGHGAPSDTVAAIARVASLRAGAALSALISALTHSDISVRMAATKALPMLPGAERALPALSQRLREAETLQWREELVSAIASIPDASGAQALLSVLSGEVSVGATGVAQAATGLGRMVYTPAIPTLIRHLGHHSRRVRDACNQALYYLTNHTYGTSLWARKRWEAWWAAHASKSRMEWVLAGFRREGIRVGGRHARRAYQRLIYRIRGGGARAFNAREVIRHFTGFYVERSHLTDLQLYRTYQYWFQNRRTLPADGQWAIAPLSSRR